MSAAEFIHKFNIPIPGIMDKFGFYYGRNGSDWWDGVFNMYTGESSYFISGWISLNGFKSLLLIDLRYSCHIYTRS